MNETMYALLGFFGGGIMGLTAWFLGRKFAKKQRGLDERHEFIQTQSLAKSWVFTFIAINVLFLLVILKVEISAPAILGILLLVHMASWESKLLRFRRKIAFRSLRSSIEGKPFDT